MVYFIQIMDRGPIKIGYSKAPEQRLKSFKSLPFSVKLVGCVDGDKRDEHYLQALLKDYAINGEWFEPTTEVLDMMNAVIEAGSVEPVYIRFYESKKAQRTASGPIESVTKYCLGCVGDVIKEVLECPIVSCWLWPYRLGKEKRGLGCRKQVF